MQFYKNIELERNRIQKCIDSFGWTSDHNLDWFLCCAKNESGKPTFVEFNNGSGCLAYKYPDKWEIWSDPLCDKNLVADKIFELAAEILKDKTKEIKCVDVSENIRPSLVERRELKVGDIDYSLLWPVLNMNMYSPILPGNHFKEIRNARNKFYREHEVKTVDYNLVFKNDLRRIVEEWKREVSKKQDVKDIYDFKYHKTIDNNFKGFLTARVFLIDGKPAGFNAGYEVVNSPGRFAGVVGIHDYSLNDLGTVLWLEDLEWVKNAGYKELDMQGSEDDGGLKLKLRFGGKIERKTDTFSIKK